MTTLFENSSLKGSYKNHQGQLVSVYTTKHYDSFLKITGNRHLVEKVVKKLMNSMAIKHNHSPLLVNEKGELLDGQHRLEACKRLGLTVTYEMIKGLSIEDVRRMNSIQKEWKIMDHLHAGAEVNNNSYKWLYNFCNLYELRPTMALVLLAGSSNNTPSMLQQIQAGIFECTLEERKAANRRVGLLLAFKKYVKYNSKNFITAFCQVVDHSDLDWDRMVDSFNKRYLLDLPTSSTTIEKYLFILQEIYNYHLNKTKKITFLTPDQLEKLSRQK